MPCMGILRTPVGKVHELDISLDGPGGKHGRSAGGGPLCDQHHNGGRIWSSHSRSIEVHSLQNQDRAWCLGSVCSRQRSSDRLLPSTDKHVLRHPLRGPKFECNYCHALRAPQQAMQVKNLQALLPESCELNERTTMMRLFSLPWTSEWAIMTCPPYHYYALLGDAQEVQTDSYLPQLVNIEWENGPCPAGMIVITSGCATLTPWAAALGGIVGGLIYMPSAYFVLHILKIDDPVDAVSSQNLRAYK